MFGSDFFQKLLNSITGHGGVNDKTDVKKLADKLAADSALVDSLSIAAIDEAVTKAVEKLQPAAINFESLLALATAASADDKAKLAVALNLGEPGEDDDDDANPEMDNLQKQVDALTTQIANLKRGGTATKDSNGDAPPKGKNGNETKGAVNEAQKAIMLKSYNDGKVTAEMYKKITGEEAPERRR